MLSDSEMESTDGEKKGDKTEKNIDDIEEKRRRGNRKLELFSKYYIFHQIQFLSKKETNQFVLFSINCRTIDHHNFAHYLPFF